MRILFAHGCCMSQPTSTAVRGRTVRPAKRAANLSLSADVLDAARRLHINVSQVCDEHLREVVRREQERLWRAEHADFVAAYNATVEAEGLPLDEWRGF
jgi:antitoxin CcdA